MKEEHVLRSFFYQKSTVVTHSGVSGPAAHVAILVAMVFREAAEVALLLPSEGRERTAVGLDRPWKLRHVMGRHAHPNFTTEAK